MQLWQPSSKVRISNIAVDTLLEQHEDGEQKNANRQPHQEWFQTNLNRANANRTHVTETVLQTPHATLATIPLIQSHSYVQIHEKGADMGSMCRIWLDAHLTTIPIHKIRSGNTIAITIDIQSVVGIQKDAYRQEQNDTWALGL